MSKTTNKFLPEVHSRAVRLLLDHEHEHRSRWAAITSVAAKIGCTGQTLNDWVKKSEVHAGGRPGVSTEMNARMKSLERENLNSGRPMRSCARRPRILPRRSSTAGQGHDRVH